MPWMHDQDKKVLRCISEKHNRHVEIDLKQPQRTCYECWRNCMFWLDREGKVTVRFQPNK